MTSLPLPVIADVDTGVDDALALTYLVGSPRVDLRAVTCVAGNASLDRVVRNTLAVLDACDADRVPVAAGADRSLAGTHYGADFHGTDGLAGIVLPPPTRDPDPRTAVELMTSVIGATDTPVTLLCLGPITNAAHLIRERPDAAARLSRIVLMGGAVATGNATPVAEFNTWHDPDALDVVLRSGIPVVMYPLDVFETVTLDDDDIPQVAAEDPAPARTAAHILAGFPRWDDKLLIGDAGAAVVAAHPALAEIVDLPVAVITEGPTRGQTVVDRRPAAGEAEQHGSALHMVRTGVVLRAERRAIVAEYRAGCVGGQTQSASSDSRA